MRRWNGSFVSFLSLVAVFLVAGFVAVSAGVAQDTKPPVVFTSEQAHQNMMDQLGIKALRPGTRRRRTMRTRMSRWRIRITMCRTR